ncbi:MAG TPA: glycosyltransferase family 39 protein [Solirubrobacteraceae bacterium]|jgi:4-amino-4-deoxy-L-arabinose transferase-like glycosyltransferase|nr:glycosyltransferase family 39 protein [Solirubrobacteraceae bacterium]
MASASDTRPDEHVRASHRRGLRARLGEVPKPLALILFVAATLSLAWDVASPSLEGPDEAKHFAYVQYLAETGHLPRVLTEAEPEVAPGSTEEQVTVNSLGLRPAITNRHVRPAWSSVDLNLLHEAERSMAHGSRTNGGSGNPLAKNPPLYYALMTIPYRAFVWLPLLKRVFLMRLLNVLFYLATIVFAWLLAGELFGAVRWKQALTAGVVALEPQMAFLSVTINPDNLLIALTTGFLLASVRLIKRGPSPWRVLAASLFAAAASLTHGRGLVTLPVLAVVLVVTWIRHRPAARGTLVLAAAGVAPVGAAFLFYALFGKATGSGSLYGGQVSELNSRAAGGRVFSVGQFASTIWNFYFEPIVKTPKSIGPKWGWRQVFIEGFYSSFGSGNVSFPKSVVAVLRALTLLGLAALVAAIVACWQQVRRAWPYVLVALSLLVTSLVFLHYVNYRAVLSRGAGHLFIGRYLLPMIALFGIAITFTAGSLPRRLGPMFGAAILGCAVLLCFTGLFVSVFRFYA